MTGRGNPEPEIPQEVRPCTELVLGRVWLTNVEISVAEKLSVGDGLNVRLFKETFPTAFLGDEAVGSISSGPASRLVECLRAGVLFEAEVIEVDKALVIVRVAPR